MAKKRRRQGRWSEELKRRIVAEVAASELSASEIARRHGLNSNLVFSWRKEYGVGAGQKSIGREVCLVPVELKPVPDEVPVDSRSAVQKFLEIDLLCGTRLRNSLVHF